MRGKTAMMIYNGLRKLQQKKDSELREGIDALVQKFNDHQAKDNTENRKNLARQQELQAERDAFTQLITNAILRKCPAGFLFQDKHGSLSTGNYTDQFYGADADAILIQAMKKFPNHLLSICKGFKYYSYSTPKKPIQSDTDWLVFSKDIGVPAYEKISRPEGFAIVLTEAGRAAARRHGISDSVAGTAVRPVSRAASR